MRRKKLFIPTYSNSTIWGNPRWNITYEYCHDSLVLQIAMGTHVGIVPYKVRPDRGTQSTATGVHISGITPLPKSNYANLRLVHGDCQKSLEDFIGGDDFGYSLVPYSGEGPWSPVFLGMRRPDGPRESLVTRYRDRGTYRLYIRGSDLCAL
ncbi:hypothetical protein BDV33DRAFT_126803 [Aspergillus novoparasiticus]|uniref:Uncharacterized protein n=1 Tax=Aspergillus novoparasiticus TaxID=986946 RepID=A0A5N6ELE3_9EURO|nr:hypothetical protein BDV33DRAFT_126803 [Aspergillus novoparasiticus]